MSYLRMLERQLQEKQQYEREALLLKELILEISDLYTEFGGDYLEKLKAFNLEYQKSKEND